MKLILIKKSYRGGTKEHHIAVKEELDDEEVGMAVEEWAEGDPAGREDGYSCEWREVDDPEKLADVLYRSITLINNRISFLEERRSNLMSALLRAKHRIRDEKENKDGA
jgi:hypothetical protein